MKNKIVLFFTVFLIFTNLYGCHSYSDNGQSKEQSQFLQEQMQRAIAEGDNFVATNPSTDLIGINLLNGKSETLNGVVETDDPLQEFNIQLNTRLSKPMDFVLKIFVDYNECSFFVEDQEYTKYIFNSKQDDDFFIPFRFAENYWEDLEYSSHIVTIAIFPEPEKNISEYEVSACRFCADFEIYNKNGEQKIIQKSNASNDDKFINVPYQGIMINQDFSLCDNTEVFFPKTEIFAHPGEEIELAFYAGNLENTDDAIIIVLMDWNQAPIDGQNFRHIKNKSGQITCGRFKLTAPKTPGSYDIISFICGSPYDLRSSHNFSLNDASTRFTLTVTENISE